MRRLISGIVEFRERQLSKYAERFRDLALAQSPDTLIVTCSDSRVVPDLLASTHPGDLFTMRNVGNLIPPATAEGISMGDLSEASAIEYALLVLKVANIVVCGHSECGAMKAVLRAQPAARCANLKKWLHHASTAAFRLEHEGYGGEVSDEAGGQRMGREALRRALWAFDGRTETTELSTVILERFECDPAKIVCFAGRPLPPTTPNSRHSSLNMHWRKIRSRLQ